MYSRRVLRPVSPAPTPTDPPPTFGAWVCYYHVKVGARYWHDGEWWKKRASLEPDPRSGKTPRPMLLTTPVLVAKTSDIARNRGQGLEVLALYGPGETYPKLLCSTGYTPAKIPDGH